MEKALTPKTQSRTHEVVVCGLTIALITVSAWITVPFGPVPFTLQTLAICFALLALTPKCALASIAGYLALGALGVPVFSSFKGGLAALMGPTGGFISGFLIAAAVAVAVGYALDRTPIVANQKAQHFFGVNIAWGTLCKHIAMGVVFLAVLYVFGWAQLMVVGNMSPEAAFLAAVAPFILIDVAKLVFAIVLAQSVGSALQR